MTAVRKPLTLEQRERARDRERKRRAENPDVARMNRESAKASAARYPERVRATKRRYDARRATNPETWAYHIVSSIKVRCRVKGVPFDLTGAAIFALIPGDMKCPALGIDLVFGRGLHRNSPSVGRLIPALGYVIGNVAVISHRANSMKQDCIDAAEMHRLADWLGGAVGRAVTPHADESRRAA